MRNAARLVFEVEVIREPAAWLTPVFCYYDGVGAAPTANTE